MYAQIEVTGIDSPDTTPLQQGFAVGARQPNDADRVVHLGGVFGFWLVIQRWGSGAWQATLSFGGLPYPGTSLVDGSASGLAYQHGVALSGGLTNGDVIRVEVTGAGGAETVNAVKNGSVVDTRDTSLLSGFSTVQNALDSTYGRYGAVSLDAFGTPGGMTFDNFEVGALP
jgi:hypothetical protein